MFFLRAPFSFPPDLANALEAAIKQKVDPRTLARLWEKLAKGRGQNKEGETHYSFRREEAEAYAAYYLPANCLKPALVLEESFLLGMDPLPAEESRWLDFGTGPGTAFWGIAWWCAKRGKQLKFTGWDQSPLFAGTARDLVASRPFAAQAEFLAGGGTPLELVKKLKPTHVSFMNSVAEIFPDPDRREAELGLILQAMRKLQEEDGRERFLLLIEPGSRESSRELATLKDSLQSRQLGSVLLPCLDARPCGALKDPKDWCHEEAACEFPDWLNELGAGAGMRKESLLFSYAWIRPGVLAPATEGKLRIVSQRMERKGQVECRLCMPEGKRPIRVQRSKATPLNEFLLEAVRGDIWKSAVIGEKTDVESAELIAGGESEIF